MNMRNLVWQSDAWAEYVELQQTDKQLLKRINKLIKDIMRNGYMCSAGKPEMLKGDLSGFASVRIDKKNLLIFRASDMQVIIIACGSHYSDH